MEEKVLVSVIGTTLSGDGADDAPVKTTSRGTLERLLDGWQLRYEEKQEDGSSQPVRFTVRGDLVEMERGGEYGTLMSFRRNQLYQGKYRTPYGSLAMQITPKQVEIAGGGERGSVLLVYALAIQGQYSGLHRLELKYHVLPKHLC